MITKDQLSLLVKKLKINESAVFREYLQLVFLSNLYALPKSSNVFFKGGTAIHLLYKAPRFSEDLDFSVSLTEKDFIHLIKDVFGKISQQETVGFKERKTIVGKRYLLTADSQVIGYKTYINLDFSLRERVLKPQKSILETDYPVLITSFVHHLSKEEIFAEKIRAVMTRVKGRDLYDLWYLLTHGVTINDQLIKKKLKYYHLEEIRNKDIIDRINHFKEQDFVLDMRPFLPIDERARLKEFYGYLRNYLDSKLLHVES